jgi:hypothetical protein
MTERAEDIIMTERAEDIIMTHRSRVISETCHEKLERLAAGYLDDAVGSLPQADAPSDPGPELAQGQTYALIGIGHALLAISNQLSSLEVSIDRN